MAHILVADDDIEQLRMQQALLEAMGYEVTVAQSAAETLSMLASAGPDLLVMDLRFPTVYDGLGLIRDVRASGYGGPLILMSGWPNDLYGAPEEKLVTRVVVKGSVRELLLVIAELVAERAATATRKSAPA